MITMGIDVGSSSVKVSLFSSQSAKALAMVSAPKSEMAITSHQSGWAEQSPELWWENVLVAMEEASKKANILLSQVQAIGITYQMHGLVVVDKNGKPLRDSIIWCDSRAVAIGQSALEEMGHEYVLENMLNSPGNFTASKLKWVKENEPHIYSQIHKIMLPGDYIAYKLSGEMSTTKGGLSEGIMWNFAKDSLASELLSHYQIEESLLPKVYDNISLQSRVSAKGAELTSLKEGTPICYRAGDQPNNAFSLGVLSPGEVAATGGTSGVVYGVTSQRKADKLSRVNTFLHVNHNEHQNRYGVLLCINGAAILNAWIKRNFAADLSYEQMNELADSVPAGSEGVVILPFGNGAERMLGNQYTDVLVLGLDLNRHTRAHIIRAAQEGIAFAFRYGMDIMAQSAIDLNVIRAGEANLFLSPIFRQTLSTITGASIELYDTDGSLGAARGAALGVGEYANAQEVLASLNKTTSVEPINEWKEPLETAYKQWKTELELRLINNK